MRSCMESNRKFVAQIEQQPQYCVKFRSKSDVVGNRGAVRNREGGFVKITAKYCGTGEWSGNLHVLLTAMNRTSENEYIPSRYALQKCGTKTKDINWELLIEEMRKLDESNNFEYDMKDIFIFAPYSQKHNAKEDPELYMENVCKKKYKAYLEFKDELTPVMPELDEICVESCKDYYANKVCLAYDIFAFEGSGRPTFVANTIYTENIHNGNNEFKIVKLCNTHVVSDGNSEMTILLSELTSEIKITLFPATDPEKQCEIYGHTCEKLQKNNAIAFKTIKMDIPKYTLTEKYVLCVQSSGILAQPVNFYYVNTDFDREEAKRKRSCLTEDEPSNKRISTLIRYYDQFAKSPLRLTGLNTEKRQKNENLSEDSAYDAVKNNTLKKFIKRKSCHKMLASAINDQCQTLLHYACEYNRHNYIKDLFRIGCPIAAPSQPKYETALHIAIERKHIECVNAFIEIINDPKTDRFPIVEMLTHHNESGYTVAHTAAAAGMVSLMRSILEFSFKTNIEIRHTPTLSLEHTLIDLAQYEEMKNLIASERSETRSTEIRKSILDVMFNFMRIK